MTAAPTRHRPASPLKLAAEERVPAFRDGKGGEWRERGAATPEDLQGFDVALIAPRRVRAREPSRSVVLPRGDYAGLLDLLATAADTLDALEQHLPEDRRLAARAVAAAIGARLKALPEATR